MPAPRAREILGPIALVLLMAAQPARAGEAPGDRFAPIRLRNGLVLPYPLDNLFRGVGGCRRGRRHHHALDIGGVGPDDGLGTPIRAIARSRVIVIGRSADDPKRFGRPDRRSGTVTRGRKALPRQRHVPGYGRVGFFTEGYGSWRSGTVVVTRILSGRLRGWTVKYMHLAAVRPGLAVGQVVDGGAEIGLLGGTAVMTDAPHLHLAAVSPGGRPADVGPLLGIGSTAVPCNNRAAAEAIRGRYTRRARALMARLRRSEARSPVVAAPARCGLWVHEGTLSKGQRAHRIALPRGAKGRWRAEVTAEGAWQPRLDVLTVGGASLSSGRSGRATATRRHRLERSADGRRSRRATLEVSPDGRDLVLRLGAWRAGRGMRRYRVALDHACVAGTADPEPPGRSRGGTR